MNVNLESSQNNFAPRLIDNGMLQLEASLAGLSERYQRGSTSHTIHVWWARRPHTAMRALAFAAFCKGNSEVEQATLKELSKSLYTPDDLLDRAQRLISKYYPSSPRALDMFAGGGTIPFEFANLGAETYSVDANELSVFIQKSILVYSQKVNLEKASRVLKTTGNRVLHRLEEETNILFPLRKVDFLSSAGSPPVGYLWTYSIVCNTCGYKLFLIKRPWLSKKRGKSIAFVLKRLETEETLEVENVEADYKFTGNWVGRNGKVCCPKCNSIIENVDINSAEDRLVAIINLAKGSGKVFSLGRLDVFPSNQIMENLEKDVLRSLDEELPTLPLPRWSGIVNPALYGVETYADFLNARQRLVLLLLIKILLEEYKSLRETEKEETAKYVISLLSGLIDQLVDWNCRLSMWISQNEQVGRAFSGPGIPMYWDYVEIDPVMRGPANLWDKLNRIVAGSSFVRKFSSSAHVENASAQKLPFENDFFDVILTDPPYYDNIYYSILANFFYVWKRILLKHIEPSLFSNKSTNISKELVASTFRSGSSQQAHEDYCVELRHAIKEAERVLHPTGVLGFIYSHSSLNGWEAIVRAFRPSKLIITSVQPLSIERKQRPRSMTSEAINICVTLVAHKSLEKKQTTSIRSILKRLSEISSEFLNYLTPLGWSEQDISLAVYANGVALLANAEALVEPLSDVDALREIETFVRLKFPLFQVKERGSL